MDVSLKITFDEEALKKLVQAEVDKITPPVPGKFEVNPVHGGYFHKIEAKFVPDEPEEVVAIV